MTSATGNTLPGPRVPASLLTLLAAAFLCAAALPLAASQQDGGPPAASAPALAYDPGTGTLSGAIPQGTDIGTALAQIGRAAGFDVQAQPGLGKLPRDIRLDGLTLDAALKRLIRGGSVVIFRTGEDATDAIAKVWVIVEGARLELTANATQTQQPQEPAIDPEELRLTRAVAAREVIALANAATPATIDRLRDLAVSAADPATRRAAISALAGAAPADSYNFVVYAGLRDPDATVRIEAARATLWIDPHNGPAVVEKAAQREEDSATRDIMTRLARGENVERIGNLSTTKLLQ